MGRVIDIFGCRNGRDSYFFFSYFFSLKCFLGSYDRFIRKNIFTSYVDHCQCIVWPSFPFDCFVKIWATWISWANGSPPPPPPPPLAKKCRYAYAYQLCFHARSRLNRCQNKRSGFSSSTGFLTVRLASGIWLSFTYKHLCQQTISPAILDTRLVLMLSYQGLPEQSANILCCFDFVLCFDNFV